MITNLHSIFYMENGVGGNGLCAFPQKVNKRGEI